MPQVSLSLLAVPRLLCERSKPSRFQVRPQLLTRVYACPRRKFLRGLHRFVLD
jgi:hypothetical protein